MKKSIQKILSLVLTAMILLGCLPAAPAMADSMEVFAFMDSYTEGEGLEVMWYNDVEGAVRYDCTVKNTTTGAYPRSRSASDTGYSAYVSGSLMTAGDYRVWVGAVNADGNVIIDGYKTFTVNAVAECDHEWSSRTGCCKLCDEECPHNNGYYEVETACTGTSISDTQHKLVWTYDKECVICRYAVSTDKTKTETGSHQFDSNGDCTLCNYRPACKHTSTVLEEISRSYSQYNETYHKVKTASSVICANANCGKELSYGSEIDTFNEKHTMVDGVCEKCNYAVTYEKMTTVLKRGQTSSVTGSGISATCSTSGGTGYYRYYWYVYHNGVEIYSTGDWTTMGSYPVTEPGSYTFAVRVEDRNIDDYATATSDVITVTEAVCAHANTAEEKTGEINYVKLSDSKHTIQTYYRKYCLDCGEELSEYYRETQEAHSYLDGNCSYCSAAEPTPDCTHPGMTSREISRSIRAYTSDEKHAVDITWEDRCASCGVVLNTTRVTSETEAHTFSGSACSKCGFALVSKACDHVNKTNEYVKTEYWSYDSARHVVSKTYRIVCQNSACDVGVLNDKYVVEEYENHQLSDNTCTVCGYRVSCTHPQTTRKGRGTDYIVLDENKHIARTTYELYCKQCSALLDDNYQEDAHFDHAYENGQCKYCHYKEALEWSESVLAPQYVNESLTHHKVIETVRTNYSDGTYSDTVTERFEEHAPVNPSDVRYETKHPHKEFYVCKCGAHPYYDGQYRMANGQMQDQNACCICLGHAWQAPQQVNGQWRETCSRCGKSRNASEPVHEHDFSLNITAAPEHPHQVSGYCSCGEFTEFLDVYGKLPNCCQCMGHDWDTSYYGGYAHDWCLRCGEWVERKTAETEAWQDYVDLVNSTRPVANQHKENYDVDKTASSLWRLIALQATNKLTEADFVFGTIALDALQNPSKTMMGNNDKIITDEELEQQKQEIWKQLIVETLSNEEVPQNSSGMSDVLSGTKFVVDLQLLSQYGIDNKKINDMLKASQHEVNQLTSTLEDLQGKTDFFIGEMQTATDINYFDTALDAAKNASEQADETAKALQEAQENLQKNKNLKNVTEAIPWVFAVAGAAAEGTDAAAKIGEMQKAYENMTLDYATNQAALISIISDAKAMNNQELADAATEVLNEMTEEYVERVLESAGTVSEIWGAVDDFNEKAEAFGEKAFVEFVGSAADIGLSKLSGGLLDVISLGATGVDILTNHSEVYVSAEELMALATMSSGIDLYSAVENEDGTDYIYKLWANLQAKGCEQAVDFIDAHKDGGWGQVTIDELGIPAKDRNDVYSQLNNEKVKYQSFGSSRVGIDQ